MKTTLWVELNASDCQIINVCRGEYTGDILTIRVKHASLPKPLWFHRSQNGNWVWRCTRSAEWIRAEGYIILGDPVRVNLTGESC